MSKKVVKKKKSKLIKTRLFTVLFAVMFIVSLFTGIKAFAETGPFKLNSATISDKSAGVTGSISSFNDSEVINDVTFHKLDDYATFKFELKSNLNREITILEITDDNSNSYIAYEYDKHENEKLASNGTLNFIVKAVYKTELTDTSKRNQTNNVKFTIKYLDNGEEKSDEIIVNPKTGDGISKSIVMLIISSVGLVTCITLDKKRKSKKLSKLSVLILTGLVLSPIVVKAATYAYELTLKSTIGLYDKIVVTIDDKVNPVTTQTIEYNTKLDSLPSSSKEGYTLTNWTVNNEEFDITKEITNDITIEANYRKNNYTITFNSNVPVGGTLDPTTSMADMNMKYDEEKNLLPNGYLVTGYLFDSWNTMPDGSGTKYEDMDSVKNLTSTDGETVTLYARWGATPYTVIFDKNSNEATGTMENISKAYNETFNLPENTYERTGYSFAGWNKSPAGDGTHYDDKQSVRNLDIDGEITLYAQWAPALITISFDINTDDPEATGTMAGQIVVYDVRNNINENKFTRTGYAFDSWNTEPDGSGTKYDDKADITNVFLDNTTLYAQWAVTPYTVIFNKNGGTGSMDNQEIAYGQQVALSKNTYTREHYKFLGWNTQEDGQGTHFDDEELVKNLDVDGEVNLYAEWKESTSTLQSGSNFNTILKDINADATKFKHYTEIPNFDNIDGEQIISTDGSNFPTYAWNDNGTIYWWSEADIVYMNKESNSMFAETNFESIDLRNFDASNVVNMGGLFQNCTNLSEINLDGWNTSNVTNMGAMFAGCSKFEELNVSNLNTSKVSNFGYIFDNMFNLKTLNITNFDFTSAGNNQINLFGYNTKPTTIIMDNVTFNKNMTNILVNQNKLTTLSLDNVNTSNVELMAGLFSGCSGITSIDLSDFNTSNVTNMSSMFSGCTNLDTINGLNTFDTSSVTTMDSMFYNMKKMENLDISSFNSSELTNINNMFKASNFKTIIFGNDFTVSKVTAMSQTFFNVSQLVNLDLSKWNPTNLTKMTYMFYGANKLEVVDMTGWNLSNVTTFTENFYMSAKIKTIYTSDSIPASATSSTGNDFNSDTLLVGGAGTTFSASNHSLTYARIDDADNGNPGYFTIKGARYIRYNNNGADGSETMTSHYLTNTGSLKANTFTNTGKTFAGWNTEPDGSGTSYTDGQLMSDLTESKTPLTLYAQWN